MLDSRRWVAAAALVLAVGVSPGFGAIVDFDASASGFDSGNGWWVYSYVLNNPQEATDNLYWLELSGLPGDQVIEGAPTGWEGWASGDDADWVSLEVGAPPDGTDVPPGGSLAGFALHSYAAPGTVEYTVFGDVSEYEGRVTGPVASSGAVPELPPACLAALGLVPLGLKLRRRSR